ncbi:hypothetical protein [Halomarina litorea]|uniref:hypothetical protein n=1 Tax=Halomarina litorea TaxID=2961595 RepID=UPI0020C1D480|nr:hypothetical protein [Halomarina sp. BCD28]
MSLSTYDLITIAMANFGSLFGGLIYAVFFTDGLPGAIIGLLIGAAAGAYLFQPRST